MKFGPFSVEGRFTVKRKVNATVKAREAFKRLGKDELGGGGR